VQSHGQVHEEGGKEMMNRGNMGQQIATAPASRLPVVTGLDQARAMAAPVKMAKGGKVTRGDGACKKGHTKGKMK
jgi:hypothetical protein